MITPIDEFGTGKNSGSLLVFAVYIYLLNKI